MKATFSLMTDYFPEWPARKTLLQVILAVAVILCTALMRSLSWMKRGHRLGYPMYAISLAGIGFIAWICGFWSWPIIPVTVLMVLAPRGSRLLVRKPES
ncbi:MAG: hypothetical protein JW861_06030 [Bacteroidales bacterium]|nr:hypothetical protein [Bacteroidales bacterium]